MIIVFANQKGGVGKTSCSLAVSYELSKYGPTALIDTDWQRSVDEWWAVRKEDLPKAIGLHAILGSKLREGVNKVIEQYDHMVIDTPGIMMAEGESSLRIAREAAMIAHCVIIPCVCSSIGIRSTKKMVEMVAEITEIRPSLKAYILINQKEPTTSMRSLVQQELDELLSFNPNIKLLQTEIHSRVVFKKADREGLFVQELDKNGPASKEIQSLIEEILNGNG